MEKAPAERTLRAGGRQLGAAWAPNATGKRRDARLAAANAAPPAIHRPHLSSADSPAVLWYSSSLREPRSCAVRTPSTKEIESITLLLPLPLGPMMVVKGLRGAR